MGEGEELGIVPRFANELFSRVDGTADSEVSGDKVGWSCRQWSEWGQGGMVLPTVE